MSSAALHLWIVSSCDVAVASLIIWEYLGTLDDEIDFIWGRSWTTLKVLYLLQRYMLFVDTVILVLHNDFTPGLGHTRCRQTYAAAGWMYAISIAISEVILSLRVLAVWGHPQKLVIGIPIFFILCFGALFSVQGLFIQSMTFDTPPVPSYGCYVSGGDSILLVAWALLMLYDGVMMILMIIPGIADYRSGAAGGLFNVVYRNGVLYYITLFLLALANVICVITLPRDLASILCSFERAMHTILTTRVVHDIRAKVDESRNPEQAMDVWVTEV